MKPCGRCRVSDWAPLRRALGKTQLEFAEMLGLGIATVKRLEQPGPHRCLGGSALKLLRAYLLDPDLQSTLVAAGHPHPFPEDLVAAAAAAGVAGHR